MALSDQQKAFITKYLPYAKVAEKETGVPKEVILAQWVQETGAGTSSVFRNNLNFAGIKDFQKGGYKKYNSIEEGVAGWIKTIKLSYYDDVRSAGTVEGAAKALVASPWEESGYQGGKLIYPLINDTNAFLNSGVGQYAVAKNMNSAGGGLSGALADSIGQNAAAGINYAGDTGELSKETSQGLMFLGVVSVAALIVVIVIFRMVRNSRTVKAVISKETGGLMK